MRLLLSTLFIFAAGCVGSVGDDSGDGDGDGTNPPPTGRTAREIFKADVHPALAKCQSAACHNIDATSPALSKFYSPTADTSYDAVVTTPTLIGSPAFSEIAPVLQYIKAGHKGLSWSADEETKIKAWLAKETAERQMGGGSGPPPPPPFDAKAALKEWSGCLSQANFDAAGMTAGWANLAGDNLQKCLNCHNGGVAGFYISANAQQFFSAISTQSAFLLKYFTVNAAERKIVIATGAFQSANNINMHPTFPVETNAGMVALKKLYDSTAARKAANQCDPGRLID